MVVNRVNFTDPAIQARLRVVFGKLTYDLLVCGVAGSVYAVSVVYRGGYLCVTEMKSALCSGRGHVPGVRIKRHVVGAVCALSY